MACGIGHWNTALNHCLELMLEGKIKGAKTSKGWVFWTCLKTQLQPWEEAIGKLEDLKIRENDVTLILTTQKTLYLSFPQNSSEAQILIRTLQNTPKGKKIAILKTDNPEKPLLIRTFNETTVVDEKTIADIHAVMQTEMEKQQKTRIEHKKQAPTTNLDRFWWSLIFGAFISF
jgi:hypothetical protein